MDNVLIYNAKKNEALLQKKKRSLFPREETRNHVYASAATKYKPADGDAYVNVFISGLHLEGHYIFITQRFVKSVPTARWRLNGKWRC